jgi:hypothetical protein
MALQSLSAEQDAEKVRQHRSRIVQTLNVPQGYASALHSLRPYWTAFLSILPNSIWMFQMCDHRMSDVPK